MEATSGIFLNGLAVIAERVLNISASLGGWGWAERKAHSQPAEQGMGW